MISFLSLLLWYNFLISQWSAEIIDTVVDNMKQFTDFIATLNPEKRVEIATKASDDFEKGREKLERKDMSQAITGISFYMSLRLLEEYHRWLNE